MPVEKRDQNAGHDRPASHGDIADRRTKRNGARQLCLGNQIRDNRLRCREIDGADAAMAEQQAEYKGKIQFVYKHLPLSFHPNAMPAAKYFEAIRLQSKEKAGKFHDEIFENFSKVRNGEKFFKAIAKKLNVDMKKLEKDLDSDVVEKRINEDLAEAKKFGFQGTPGFLINGIPVKGAYPASHFEEIVKELVKRGKLKL